MKNHTQLATDAVIVLILHSTKGLYILENPPL